MRASSEGYVPLSAAIGSIMATPWSRRIATIESVCEVETAITTSTARPPAESGPSQLSRTCGSTPPSAE